MFSLLQVLQYPVKLQAVGSFAGPVFVDRSNEAFLFALQQVPHGIACGGRTGVVVESPCQIGLGLDIGSEADHIVVRQRLEVSLGEETLCLGEMRISVGATFLCCGTERAG